MKLNQIPIVQRVQALRLQDQATRTALQAAGLASAKRVKPAGVGPSLGKALALALFCYGPAWFGFNMATSRGLPSSLGLAVGLGMFLLFWTALLSAIRPANGSFRAAHNHGAEHMVIDAWRRHGNDWHRALHESRHRLVACGTTYILWQALGLYVLASAILWFAVPARVAVALLVVGLVVWPALVVEAMAHERTARVLGGLGLFGQRLSTERPESQDLDLAIAAGEALFGLDPVPEIRGAQGSPADMERQNERQDTWEGSKRTAGRVVAIPSGLLGAGALFAFMKSVGGGVESLAEGALAGVWFALSMGGLAIFSVCGVRSGLLRPRRAAILLSANAKVARGHVPHAKWFRRLTFGLLIALYAMAGILSLLFVDMAVGPNPAADPEVPRSAYLAALAVSWAITAGPLLLLAVGLHFWRRRGRRQAAAGLMAPTDVVN